MTKAVSRQRLWQIKQAKAGNCRFCGRKAVGHALCAKHVVVVRQNCRRHSGCKPRYLGSVCIDDTEAYRAEQKKVVSEYLSGRSSNKLAEEYGTSAARILNIVHHLGYRLRRGRKKA